MQLALEIAALVVGFTFLAKGSDWLVSGSSTIAQALGIRPLVVGLTVVAWGTSAPEVVVSGLAAYQGQTGITIGNVLGSNVANIGLVLGLSTLVLPDVLRARLGWREAFWLVASVLVFWGVALDGDVTRVDALVLLGALSIYNVQLLWEARQSSIGAPRAEVPRESFFERRPGLAVLLGITAISLAAKAVMIGATGLAVRAGLSEHVIGLTVVAVGTSLPELAAGVSGALKGHADISIGNVVGSNVFNVLGVVGVVGLIHPFGGAADPAGEQSIHIALGQDFAVVMGFSLAVVLLPMIRRGRMRRVKGGLLFLGWLAYTVVLVVSGGGA
ncbi:MAG: calcium/sodium antiporter [Planctomycetes bacterium]|nr:calcium/sodium antiporter [Planctomycetota bacterium]